MRLAERVTLASILGALVVAACDFGINLRGLTDGSVAMFPDARLDTGSDAFVPPMPAIDLATGGSHTCAVRVDGTITCWGAGADGRLGNGGYVDSSTPVLVQGVNDARSVTAGSNHTCAIDRSNRAACWGNNSSGQLGDGSTSRSPTPVPVMGATDIEWISAGNAFTCAIRSDRKVYCWGQSGDQLGFPNVINQPLVSSPVQGLSDVTDVECGSNHACAITNGGDVYCWGSNSQGQLGQQTDGGSSSDVALRVDLPGKVGSITAGSTHSCAVMLASHEAYCWGTNTSGQLGNGSVASTFAPTKVVSPAIDFIGVSAGTNHTCARRTNGAVGCWGSNVAGQLGTGDTMMSTIPVETAITAVTKVVSGAAHSCALGATGTIKCWGHNGNGRIGTGTRVGSAMPVPVGGLANVFDLAVGSDHSCARGVDAGTVCWGDNGSGQVGVSTGTLVATSTPIAPAAQGLTALVAGGADTCGVFDGGAYCWGANTSGQLGNGSTSSSHNAVRFGAQSPFATKSIALGSLHTCGVATNGGDALCSGNNGSNQLGTGGTPTTSSNPIPVLRADGGLANVTKLWAGTTNACATTSGNELLCWGLNTSAQAGIGTKQLPAAIATPATAWSGPLPVYVGFGASHACALRVDSKVVCWGAGTQGQLGDGMGVDRTTPVVVANGGVVTQLAVGSNHACAIVSGLVECWGAGTSGQIGNGETKNQPIPVKINVSAQLVAAGGDNTCVVVAGTRAVQCWGPNVDGQLGDGTPTFFPVPMSVTGY